MAMFEDRTARVTFQATSWSGWERESYSDRHLGELKVAKGTVLSPVTLGFKKSDYEEVSCLFYEVELERVVEEGCCSDIAI